jgi:hypothetical protein
MEANELHISSVHKEITNPRFAEFKQAVAKQFDLMKNHQLFRTDVEKDLLWFTYLSSFPEGSNLIMKERLEYDCQACKNFIRAAGNMVAIIDNKLVSLWDCEVCEPYSQVAKALSELVKSAPIKNVFLHNSAKVGIDKNFQNTDYGVIFWKHFHIVLPKSYVSNNQNTIYADRKSTKDVFLKGLTEITIDAIECAIELIEQGSLYRGDEHLPVIKLFLKQKKLYDKLNDDKQKDIFVWQQNLSAVVTRIRNTAIGTLLIDLSNGKSLDEAVRMFESKVAPSNYKRPKALVTKDMIKRARKTVEELGYTSALERRFAVIDDISITDILFANRDARKKMNADVFDEIMSETKVDQKKLEKVEEIGIEDFIENVLPKAISIELLLENRHAPNFVNLVAPKDPNAKLLFKWSNNFSWAYAGNLADSIKERVKSRGGCVTGDFRASLGWFNSDDLDIHLVEPDGHHIYYGNKKSIGTKGELDVDMNVSESGINTSRNAVENITYPNRNRMLEGQHHLYVNNYTHRERIDVGFEVEIEFGGTTTTFAYDREVKPGENITVAKFKYTHANGIRILESLPKQESSRVLWNLQSQNFHQVTMAMLSPNYWNDNTGNKHYFFILQDCKRDGSSRGFFNEYLNNDLNEHRKVFEILGNKMHTEENGDQLSGLGFSSTQRNKIYARVTGAFTRTINIVI